MNFLDQNTLNKLTEVQETDYEKLKRTDLGPYNFEVEAIELKDAADGLTEILQNLEVVKLSEGKIKNIGERIRSLASILESIKGFDAMSENARSVYGNLKNTVKDFYDQYLDNYEQIRTLIALEKFDSNKLEVEWGKAQKELKAAEAAVNEEKEKLRVKQDAVDELLKTSKETLNEYVKKVDDELQEVRNAFGEQGALISSDVFEKQATTHKELAKKWLIASILSITATFALIIVLFNVNFFNVSDSQELGPVIFNLSYKFLILSIAYVTVKESLKNYRVNQHLSVISKHRDLSLSVFSYMVQAAKTNEDTVVTHAAKAIFEAGTTGYLIKDEAKTTPVNPTEIITNVIGSKN